MAQNLPDVYTGVAFNAEPFDPSGVPIWVDLSTRYVGTGSATRGRSQYELDQDQTGQADVTWYDQDEALNPGNTGSPYYPYVVPYRPFLWRVMWPNGGTGNIVNGVFGAGIDGSFESEPVGGGSGWLVPLVNLAGVGGTTVGVVGAGAWQGTRAAQLAIGSGVTRPGGVQFPLPLIPGRQYTVQAHVNQTGATPFELTVANQTVTVDPFNRTVAANSGWGTPTSPLGFASGAWVCSPSNTGFSVASGSALVSLSAVSTRLTAFTTDRATNHAVQDVDQWVTVAIPVAATGQAIQSILYARYVNATNNLACLISFNTDTTVTVTAQKLVAGVTTTIGTNATVPGGYQAGDSFRVHMRVVGPDVWCKAWKVNTPVPEPAAWTTQGSDNAVTVPGQLGVSSILTTGNTNTLPVVLAFGDYRAIGSVVDTAVGVTSTGGAYVLLTTVFTATQPIHQIQLRMQAAPSATNTVLVDGVQVEPGGTANTFTTAGPIIRSPWTRGYIERWPAQWDSDSRGFLGVMSGPAVGPFFQLASATLYTEYVGSVLAKNPAYYWRLNEQAATSTTFGDQSGNGGASLYRWDAVEGAASVFAPGTATNIPGNPDGVGLDILADINVFPNAGSILLAGDPIAGAGQYLTGLGGNGLSWGTSFCFWLSSTGAAATARGEMLTLKVASSSGGTAFFGLSTTLAGVHQGPQALYSVPGIGSAILTPLTTAVSGIDGLPHHYTATLNFANDVMVLTVYYDGALYGTISTTVSTWFGQTTLPSAFTAMQVAGERNFSSPLSMNVGLWGTYSDIAVFNRALSPAEIADLYQAGRGYPGENSGTRMARYIALGGYPGVTDIRTGLTTMGVSTLAEGTAALSACQDVQDTEFGNLYESQEGIAFRGRQARYLAVSPSFVFGENVAAGEWPYEDGLTYDDDATYVYNVAIITRVGGAVLSADDSTGRSQMRYGQRTFTRTVNGNSDLEAQDAANYVVANSKDARQRLASLTFNPAAVRGVTASPDGTLWPMLLKLEIGMRVTVKRRPKAANGGVGLTMSGDFYVESISPNTVDEGAGTFLVKLLLSPAPVVSQPWILEDATWGQLDSTTVLGF